MKALTFAQPWASLCVKPRPDIRRDGTAADTTDRVFAHRDMTVGDMNVLPCWKTIETRPFAAPAELVGARIAIHAAGSLAERVTVGQFEAWPADDPAQPHPNHPDGRPARLYRNDAGWLAQAHWNVLPLDAVVGTAVVKACIPVIGYRDADNNVGREVNFGAGWVHPIDGVHGNARYADMIHAPRFKVDFDPHTRVDAFGVETVDARLEVQGVDGPGWCRDVSDQEPFATFEPGMFAWLLGDVERFDTPIAATGDSTGLWDWEQPATADACNGVS